MALIEDPTVLPGATIPDASGTVPGARGHRAGDPRRSWVLVALGAAAALLLGVAVIASSDDGGSSDRATVVEDGSGRGLATERPLIIEYGSLVALEHAAEAGDPVRIPSSPGTGVNHQAVIEGGSIVARDHRTPSTPGVGEHSSLVDDGSIVAREHAAETSGS